MISHLVVIVTSTFENVVDNFTGHVDIARMSYVGFWSMES